MDDNATKENPPQDFNKLDLSQLQSFSFGTQWTQDKAAPPGGARPPREPRREDRPPRAREGGGDRPGEPRRDRRDFRRPAGPGGDPTQAPAPRPGGGYPARAPRSDDRGGNFRGPPRDDREPRGDMRGGGYRREPEVDRGPYLSPYFTVTFYPEETSFATLVKTLRASCRTVELFDIARAVVGKSDRCIAVVQRPAPASPPAAGADAVKPAPLALAVPDGFPFENEEAAIAHVLTQHLDKFFEVSEVEVEPPKGNFQVINKCGVTGELLGPPNYHRYPQIIQQHHAAKVRLPFEVFRGRIESVRDPEVINQWLAKMKKAVRYTWKVAAEGDPAPAFESLEDARQHLLTHVRDQVVKLVEQARFPGKLLETLPQGEIRRAAEGALERQRKFPLESANALRGRLRREGFTIFKKGSKGISYVCAVRRKFRTSGQVFADSIGALITFLSEHPMIRRSELPAKFLGIKVPAQTAPAQPTVPTGEPVAAESPAAEAGGGAAAAAAHLSTEDRERFAKLQGDLRWLISEGYVMEFMDGRLFSPLPIAEAKKVEAEAAEHDPENFPESASASPLPPAAAATETTAADAETAPVDSSAAEPEIAAAAETPASPEHPVKAANEEPPAAPAVE